MTIHAPPPDARGVRPQGAVGARRCKFDLIPAFLVFSIIWVQHGSVEANVESWTVTTNWLTREEDRKFDCKERTPGRSNLKSLTVKNGPLAGQKFDGKEWTSQLRSYRIAQNKEN